MAERSLLWTTGAGGDGASTYTQSDMFNWLKRTMQANVTSEAVIKNYANQLAVTGTSSPVSVGTGAAYVYGIPYENDAPVQFAIPTPTTGATGHRIVLRADYSAKTVRLALKSSADGTPTAPSLTQVANTTWEVPIAFISITTGGIITITDQRSFIHMGTAVSTSMIDSNAVTNDKMADNAISTSKIQDGAVTSSKILDGTIQGGDIANETITTLNILNGTIQTNDISNGGVWEQNLATNAVSTGKIQDGAVTSAKIADGTIQTSDIGDGQVTAAKLSGSAARDNLGLGNVNAGIEMGSTSSAGAAYFDFHTSGNNTDFDVRVSANGGTASVGNGYLDIAAAYLKLYGDSIATAISYRLGSNATNWYTQATIAATPQGYAVNAQKIKILPISFNLPVPATGSPAYSLGVSLTLPNGYFSAPPIVVGSNAYDPANVISVTVTNATTINIKAYYPNANFYGSFVNGSCLLIGPG